VRAVALHQALPDAGAQVASLADIQALLIFVTGAFHLVGAGDLVRDKDAAPPRLSIATRGHGTQLLQSNMIVPVSGAAASPMLAILALGPIANAMSRSGCDRLGQRGSAARSLTTGGRTPAASGWRAGQGPLLTEIERVGAPG